MRSREKRDLISKLCKPLIHPQKKNDRVHFVLGLSPREVRDHRKPRLRRRYADFNSTHDKTCGLSGWPDRYNPSNIGILEDYLYHQTRSEGYDCLANLAILKLFVVFPDIPIAMNLISSYRYQFNPTLYNSDVVIHILIKALTSSPFPDFHLCVSLLDERPSSANADEPDPLPSILPQLQQLYALLQQCRFPAFWVLYLSEEYRVLREEYTVESVAFEDSVRGVVVRAVKAAFTKIGVKRLSGYFNLESMFSSAHSN